MTDSQDERLGDLFKQAIDTLADTRPVVDLPALRRCTLRRRLRWAGRGAGVVVAALIAGLGIGYAFVGFSGPDGLAVPAPAGPVSSASPAEPVGTGIRVQPATVAPGSSVALYFPASDLRGVAFTLESLRGSGWTIEYYLVAAVDGAEPGPDAWFRPGTPNRGWSEVGVSGGGGEKVLIPPVATAGPYRICTADARNRVCGPVTVS